VTARRVMSLGEALHRGRFLVNVAVRAGEITADEGEHVLEDIAIAAFEKAAEEAENVKRAAMAETNEPDSYDDIRARGKRDGALFAAQRIRVLTAKVSR
jgi:polyhydroxyalkanoate synthesis regulator phasin